MTEEEISKWLSGKLEAAFMEAMMGGTQPKQRQTALRVKGNSFETVELDDAGNVVEPPQECTCGRYAILHRPNCPAANYIS